MTSHGPYFSQSYKTKRGAIKRAEFENQRARPDVRQYRYSAAREENGKGWRVDRSVIRHSELKEF